MTQIAFNLKPEKKKHKKEGRYEGLRPSGDAGEPALKK
jgi:hypothetical protein